MTADGIESNANFSKVLEAKQWIHERYPLEATSLFFSCSIMHNLKTGRPETEDNDLEELDDSVDPVKGNNEAVYTKTY